MSRFAPPQAARADAGRTPVAATRPRTPVISPVATPGPQPRDLLSLQHAIGNGGVTRLVQRQDTAQAPTAAPAAAAPRTELDVRYNGDYALAAQAVKGLWDTTGGVVARQQQAVTDFIGSGGAASTDPPSLAESLIVGALETALGLALGGIGTAIINRLGGTIRAAVLAGAIQGEATGTVPAEVVGAAGRLAQEFVTATVDAGKSTVTSYVSSSVRGRLPQATPLAQFGRGQMATLNEVSIAQGEQMLERLANAPAPERWVAAQGIYDALQASLRSAYVTQRDAMTDTWLTAQVRHVGGGAEPGVLNVTLTDVYADHRGPLRIDSANLLGAGANATVRGWVADRPLEDVGIPKVVTMNGSLGAGILDCIFTLRLWSAPPPATGPSIRSATPDPLAAYLAGGPATLQRLSNNRWGDDWLAAYHLGLQDIDGDDPRVSAENIVAGAHKVWDNIKGASISARGGSVGASSW
ncbi:hypothetical protein [Pseudactinotalea sp. HY158]|uniref:hypothetical protein n=1 Tax=Pseudactinotalea sp. HY158 TaxID=2654547 RepID=UPI00129CA303|nr:hypothetical protein [Pseudactinotalea sp. HY158]QGH68789.1 hypothetical protein GCE65_04205 [Pseudactinotalea sp. HY158]